MFFYFSTDNKLKDYEKKIYEYKDKTKELSEKLSTIELKHADLSKGLGKLPKDIPDTLRKAVDNSLSSINSSIDKDSKEILKASTELRDTMKKLSFELLSMYYRYERKSKYFKILDFLPVFSVFFTLISEKKDFLNNLIIEYDDCFERLIGIKSVSATYPK